MNEDDSSALADTLLGVLIVLVSVFGAFVTWRAAEAAGAASDFDLRGRQAAIFADQLRREHASTVSYEGRLFDAYRDHVRTANALAREATRLEFRGSRATGDLWSEVRAQRAIARALELPFELAPVTGVYPGDPASRPKYDAKAELERRLRGDPRLEELRPRGLKTAANKARAKRLALVAIDTAVIAAIFFLTLALLGARLRRMFAVSGVVLVAAAAVAFVLVQFVFLKVPSL